MASYIIPPRLKSQDYSKGAITQDEMLRIAIANDANIAAARKAVKLGEVVQLTPIQSATPDQLLGDIAKQESDARLNLLKLGFRDQEVSTIIANLLNEQDVLRALNINFPAIEADVKRRFNPRLLTPTFFLNYLREYNETLNASRGLDVNSSASIRRPINALINSVAEMRAILPDPEVIGYIANAVRAQRAVGADTLDALQRIEEWLNYAGRLGALPPAQQFGDIQRVLDALQNLPNRTEIQELFLAVQRGVNTNTGVILKKIESIAAAAPREPAPAPPVPPMPSSSVPPMPSRPTRVVTEEREPTISDITGETDTSQQSLASSVAIDTATLAQIKETFRANPELEGQLQAISNVGKYRIGDRVQPINLAKKPPANKPNQQRIFIDDTNIRDIFRTKFGRGIKATLPSVKPVGKAVSAVTSGLKKIKIGKGLAVKETPTYREFGKYAIHIPQLEQQDLLNVKYKSLGGIPKFKPIPVSDIFRDFLLDLLEGGKVNQRVYLQIEPKERKVFEEMAIGAGLWNSLGLKRTTTSTDEEDRKRFELLKGEYIAGNNSPKVLQELRRLVVKFINEGKIRKSEGMNLLMELSI
jgi:hypothetical protein